MSQTTIIKSKLLFGEVLTAANCIPLRILRLADIILTLRRPPYNMNITTRLVRNKTNASKSAEYWMSKQARQEYLNVHKQMRKAA